LNMEEVGAVMKCEGDVHCKREALYMAEIDGRLVFLCSYCFLARCIGTEGLRKGVSSVRRIKTAVISICSPPGGYHSSENGKC